MKNILEFRRLYFIGLFSGIVYFPLLTLILGKTPLKDTSFFGISLISLSSFIILGIVYSKFRQKLYDFYKTFIILGHLPLIIGFALSILEKNYLYILISFPVFLIIYILLIPKGED